MFVAACVAIGGAAGSRQATDVELGVGESGRALKIVQSGDFDDPARENVLITATDGTLNQDQALAAAGVAAERLAVLPGVRQVGEPVTSADGSAVLVPMTMTGDPETTSDRVAPLQGVTESVQRAHPELRIVQVGDASIGKAINDRVGEDLLRAEMISLPVTLLLMLVTFGAIIAAGVPVLLALSAVGSAIGLAALVSHLIPAVQSTNSVIMMLGMAVGIDYSLFYLKREREERARGRVDAIEIAAATSGHSVVVSGLAVIISMAGLYLANDVVFSSLGTGAILVVGVAVLGSLTVLPAVLATLGPRVDRPRVPLLWRLTSRPNEPRAWPILLRPARRRPLVTLLVATTVLAALAVPALGMQLRSPSADTLPESIPEVAAYHRMAAAFPSQGATHTVAVRVPAAQADRLPAALQALAQRSQASPLLADDRPPRIRISASGTVGVLEVATPYEVGTDRAVDSLQQLRSTLVPATVGAIDGAEYAVGGDVASDADYSQHHRERLPWVIGFVLLLTFIMMTATFRSVVIALATVVLNILSAGAAFRRSGPGLPEHLG